MSRWVDVRLSGNDVGKAITLLAQDLAPMIAMVRTHPPSAAPGQEWELSIADRSEDEVQPLLDYWRIETLAIRERSESHHV